MSLITHKLCMTLRLKKQHANTPLFQFSAPIHITYANKTGQDLFCKILEQTANWALKTASISGIQELTSNLTITVRIIEE